MGKNAQERRRARKAKAARRQVRPVAGAAVPVRVLADHAETAAGWTTELVADTPDGDLAQHVGPYPTVHETFHAAMAAVRALADDFGSALTVHRLDGDTDAWAILAAREGLAEDAGCDCGECRPVILARG